MNVSYHHGDLRAVLLAHAREQMESADIDSLSMREMAKAVGVSHTAAYRHFSDKRDLLDAVAVQGFDEMLAAIGAALGTAPAGARAQLKAAGLAYVGAGLDAPRLLAHMFSAISQPNASDTLAGAGARLFDLLRQLVGAGQADGAFRAGDAAQLSHTCWAMVHGLATLLGVGMLRVPGVQREGQLAYAEQALEIFLDGLAMR